MAKKFRRVLSLLVSVCMISSALCLPVLADGDPNEVTYYDSSSSTLNTRTDCVILDENNPVIADTDDGEYNGTWYYLDKDIAFDDKVQVTGTTVRLILKDGCTLTANAGIDVQATYFYVYNSSSQNNGAIVSRSQDSAGIQVNSGCNIYINGGSIDSTGADGFAGIGGATDGDCGSFYAFGGNITAQGGAGGAGIGAGSVNGFLDFRQASVEARAGEGTAPGIGYWDRVYYLHIYENARIDAYGGSAGGPGIGYCGNGEPNSLVNLQSVYNCEKGYVHAKGHNNAFSSLASSYGYFNNWSQWALFYGENGEKIALAEERDNYFDTLPEVWLKPCPCPDAWYEDIEKDMYGHNHHYDCQYCAYKRTNYEYHAFDSETHLCVCGLGEYPVSVEGCPNGYEIIHAGPSNVVNTDGYVSSGWRLPIMMYSDNLGDIYCAKLAYVDPDTSSEVVLYKDSLDYDNTYSAYYIIFFTDYQQMTDFLMPEVAVAVQVYEKYAVSFDAGEGSGSMDCVYACPYKDFVLPVNEFTPPEGSVFYGWKVKDDETIYQPGDCVALTGNTQLTAVYADASTTPSFKAHSLLLSGQIGVRFRVQYPDSVDPRTSYVDFKCSDGKTKRMNYSEAKIFEDGTTVFTFLINPLELADTVSATLHYGENGRIADVYSAMAYISAVMDDTTGKYDDEKELVNALWGYGYSFQFAGWSDGKSHAKIPVGGGESSYYEAPIKSYINRFSKEGTENAGINDVMYSLTLTSDTALHFYISLDDGVTVSSVDSATASGEVTISGKKYLKYSIKGIAPQNLNNLQKVMITTSLGTATLRACPMSYVYDVNFVIPMKEYDERNWKQSSLIQYYFYHRAALNYYNAHNTEG